MVAAHARRVATVLTTLALAALGCAEPQYPLAQFAAAAAPGSDRYWVVGRYGFAAEGRGPRLRRADFPETSATPDWAWEAITGTDTPGGHVVELDGRTYLFTLGSEVFRRDAAGWSPVAVRFTSDGGPPGADPAQINRVLVTSTGEALVHVHPTELYWVDGRGIERGVMKRERLPHFFTWLGFANGVLHGVGWQGDDRAVFARAGMDRWTKVAQFAKPMGEPKGVVPLSAGRIGVVIDGAVTEVAPGGAMRVVPIDELLSSSSRAPLQVAGGEPGANATAAPSEPSAIARAPTPTPQVVAPGRSPESPRAGGGQILAPQKEERRRVQGVIHVGPDRYALPVSEGWNGADTLVLVGTGDGNRARRVVRCDILRASRPIGVIEAKDGTVYVPTHRGSIVEMREDGACGEPQPPLLPSE